MKLTVDTEARTLTVEDGSGNRRLELYSNEAFELLSDQWLKVGWNQKYPYTFSWLGRPIIQLPEDVLRIQEVIFRAKPQVIIETGVAHGGSVVLYASILKAMGIAGRVIGIDVLIRPGNRKAIEHHELASMITLIQGDSAAPETVARAKALISPGQAVLVVLDSCHTKEHVTKELLAYHGLVTPGSYIVATDGSMRELYDVPAGDPSWREDNPAAAAQEFVRQHPEFTIEQPAWSFNESSLHRNITHWPDAFLRRNSKA
jgi:cephalosporin hydroxylase